MSAGAFTRGRYQSDNTDVHPIRVQPETILATFGTTQNIEPSAPIGDGLPSAKVSGGRRQFGVNARFAVIAFEDDPPDGYKLNSPIKIPILLLTTYAGISKGQSVSYLDKTAIVLYKRPEQIN